MKWLFCLYICKKNGDVAQLARVLDWQSRGRGFEPHLLHFTNVLFLQGVFYLPSFKS